MRRLLALLLALSASTAGCDFGAVNTSGSQWYASGLPNIDVQTLAARADTLYAATGDGVYRRPLEPEAAWTAFGLQDNEVVDVTWRADGAMLAGVRSDDSSDEPVLYKRALTSGNGWTAFDEGYGPNPSRTVQALTAHPSARDTLYARGLRNVARSVDGGQQWESVYADWDDIGAQAPLLYVSPHDPAVVFAGGETSIFQPHLVRSSDHGTSWDSPISVPSDGDNAVYSMIEHPSEPGHYLLGMEGQILRSTDGGRSWTVAYEPPGYTYVFDFAARRAGTRPVIYAAGSENGTQGGPLTLHRTEDFGNTWTRIVAPGGPPQTAIRSLLLAEVNDEERLYLGTMNGVYVYRP